MKIKWIIFSLIIFFSFFLTANAAGYYYLMDDGNYMLCAEGPFQCFSVQPGQDNVTFNLSDEEIIYQGYSYFYDEEYQEDYYETLYGKTRMYFYQNADGNYVLCETENSCRTYTFDRLVGMGASITSKNRIEMGNAKGPGEPGDIYYYNSEKEAQNTTQENQNPTQENQNPEHNTSTTLESSEYCGKLKEPLKFIGNIVLIVKIIIPIIIIAFGMIDFFRAMVGSKDDEIKKSFRSLIFRVIAGIVIFLIPTIVSFIFSLVDSWASIEGEFNACQKCVLNVRECK